MRGQLGRDGYVLVLVAQRVRRHIAGMQAQVTGANPCCGCPCRRLTHDKLDARRVSPIEAVAALITAMHLGICCGLDGAAITALCKPLFRRYRFQTKCASKIDTTALRECDLENDLPSMRSSGIVIVWAYLCRNGLDHWNALITLKSPSRREPKGNVCNQTSPLGHSCLGQSVGRNRPSRLGLLPRTAGYLVS